MTSKHWIILSLVLAVLGIVFFTGYHFRKVQAWEETVQSLNVEIEQLETQIKESTKSAEIKLENSKEPEKKAEALAPIIEDGRRKLAVARKAAIKAEDEVVLLRGQNALLEEALRLRNKELDAKNAAIQFFQLSINQYDNRAKLQEEKYTALKRGKRAEKRKRIGLAVLSHVAVGGLMYGLGTLK